MTASFSGRIVQCLFGGALALALAGSVGLAGGAASAATARSATAAPFSSTLIQNGNADARAAIGDGAGTVPDIVSAAHVSTIRHAHEGGDLETTAPGLPDRGNQYSSSGSANAPVSGTHVSGAAPAAHGIDTGGVAVRDRRLPATSGGDSWLDLMVIGIIVISCVMGLCRGLIRSVAGLVGLILAAHFAGQLATLCDRSLNKTLDQAHIQHPPITGTVAFVLAFVLIVVAVELAANLLRFVEKLLFLGWIDQVGGALFGAARGVLLCMVLLAALATFNSSQFNSSLRQAQVAGFLWQNAARLGAMLPPTMQECVSSLAQGQPRCFGQHLPRQ